MDGAVIGHGSIVAGGAFIKEGSVFPPHSIIAGMPAQVIKTRDCTQANRLNAWQYRRNAEFYQRGEHDAWRGQDYEEWLVRIQADIAAGRDVIA